MASILNSISELFPSWFSPIRVYIMTPEKRVASGFDRYIHFLQSELGVEPKRNENGFSLFYKKREVLKVIEDEKGNTLVFILTTVNIPICVSRSRTPGATQVNDETWVSPKPCKKGMTIENALDIEKVLDVKLEKIQPLHLPESWFRYGIYALSALVILVSPLVFQDVSP